MNASNLETWYSIHFNIIIFVDVCNLQKFYTINIVEYNSYASGGGMAVAQELS
jgi:hypothetical protein